MLRGASLPGRLRPVWFGIDDAAADVRAEEIRDADGGSAFTLVDAEHGRFAVTIPTVGLHTVRDALAAYAAATPLGLDPARAAAGLARYQTTGMRRSGGACGVTFIEDCYNASPDSLRAAVDILAARTPGPGGAALPCWAICSTWATPARLPTARPAPGRADTAEAASPSASAAPP